MMDRRNFVKLSTIGALYFSSSAKGITNMDIIEKNKIRLGGPVFKDFDDPLKWIKAHKNWGYSAAYCPVDANADDVLIREYKKVANDHNLIIAEVGAWSNPISPDDDQRNSAFEHCCKQLELADKIGENNNYK